MANTVGPVLPLGNRRVQASHWGETPFLAWLLTKDVRLWEELYLVCLACLVALLFPSGLPLFRPLALGEGEGEVAAGPAAEGPAAVSGFMELELSDK